MRQESFNTFKQLVIDQFEYGGKKYAFDKQRESTDILFDVHGKNWLFGTIDKYTFRFRNLARERDILKIACYQYILWLKRGFFMSKDGINDPPIDTNLKNKEENFNTYINKASNFINNKEDKIHVYLMKRDNKQITQQIHILLSKWSKIKWKNLSEIEIFTVFFLSYMLWLKNFSKTTKHDTDTYNNPDNVHIK